MADSSANILIPTNQWIDLYLLSGITPGAEIIVENIGVFDVFVTVRETEPPLDYDAYIVIGRNDPPYRNALGSLGAWAYCQGGEAKLSVREANPSTGFFLDEEIRLDPFVEIARGNIPGQSLYAIQAREDDTQTIFTDIWGGAGDLVYPTVAENWEIVSTSSNDSAAGTGARTGVIVSLDINFNEVITPFALNGITPVVLSGTHYRIQDVFIITAGSNTTNEGVITLRQQGGGLTRSIVPIGQSRSYDSHFTVPANKTAFVLQTFNLFGKNLEGEARLMTRDNNVPNAAWTGAIPVPLYQNIINFNVQAKLAIGEKTDIKGSALSKTGGGELSVIVELLIVDKY